MSFNGLTIGPLAPSSGVALVPVSESIHGAGGLAITLPISGPVLSTQPLGTTAGASYVIGQWAFVGTLKRIS